MGIRRSILSAFLALTFLVTPTFAMSTVDIAGKLRVSSRQMVMSSGQEIVGYCTAFSINDDKDYFLTAAHCVQGTDYDVLLDKDGAPMQAFPIYVNLDADLAVLVVPESGEVPAIHLGSSIEQGQPIYNYGYGYAFNEPMFRAGYVSIVDLFDESKLAPDPGILVGKDQHFTVTDFAFVPGQSGGPVVNAEGKLITITQLGDDKVGFGRTLSAIVKLVGKYFEKE